MIDRQFADFNKYFKEQIFYDLSSFIENVKSSSDFSDFNTLFNNRSLKSNPSEFESGDLAFIYNIDIFNRMSISVDLDMLIIPEYVQILDSKNFKGLSAVINIDYNPLKISNEVLLLVAHILKQWDGVDSDTTGIYVGYEMKLQRNFGIHQNSQYAIPNNPSVNCILFTRPSAKKVQTELSSYLRQAIHINFVIVLYSDLQFFGRLVTQ